MAADSKAVAAGLRILTPQEVRAIMAELGRGLANLYGRRLRGLFLFGSYARGDAEVESDLDVLVVLDEVPGYMAEIRRAGGLVGRLALHHHVSITPVFVPEREWADARSAFIRNVRAEGIAAP